MTDTPRPPHPSHLLYPSLAPRPAQAPPTPDAPPAPAAAAAPRRPITRQVQGRAFDRIPVRTHVLTEADDIVQVAVAATADLRRPGDTITVSEKVVAVTQGRARRESEMRIGLPARLLWRCVKKSPYGVGLRRPSSMQCAIDECGLGRILLASVAGALGKLVGRSGDFYRVAGMQAATIDAAGTSPLQPDCVILGPLDPDAVARAMAQATGCACAVMDINDIGGSWVLGASDGVDRPLLEAIMNDNPCGQKSEQTPLCLVRPHS